MTPMFALAFDHRNSFRRDFMRLPGAPTPQQHEAMVAAKGVVVEAVVLAAQQVTAGRPALLIDAEYGGEYVAAARDCGVVTAMPVEVSGQRELRFENDGDFAAVVESWQPDFVKVLIRYNPAGDGDMNIRQRARLGQLATWLEGRPQQLMLELLVPPEPGQMTKVGGDRTRFDVELRAELTSRAIAELGGDGLRPALWKLEGPSSTADAELVAEAVRDIDPNAGCLVLGRGADREAVCRWLTTAAAVRGFAGFAVGRTVWWDALRDFLAGGDRDETVKAIAASYLALVDAYLAAM